MTIVADKFQEGNPTVVFTRPRDWADGGYGSNKLNLVYVPISGPRPRKRNGKLAGDGIGDVVTSKGTDMLIQAFKDYQPDMFVHGIHRKILEPLLKNLRRISPKTLFACVDGNQPHAASTYARKYRAYTEAVLINSKDPSTIKKYKLCGYKIEDVGTLYDGFTPTEHPLSPVPPDYDCLFAGGNHLVPMTKKWRFPGGKFRRDFVYAMAHNFNLLLHGTPREWPQLNCQGVLGYPHYFPALQRAKIILGCNQYQLGQYYTRRTVHALASGRMFLTRWIPGMDNDFENHKHLVWFKTVDEAVELMRYYLLNNEKRKEIGREGRVLAMNKFTWEARLRDFEEWVPVFLAKKEENKKKLKKKEPKEEEES